MHYGSGKQKASEKVGRTKIKNCLTNLLYAKTASLQQTRSCSVFIGHGKFDLKTVTKHPADFRFNRFAEGLGMPSDFFMG